MNDAPARGEGVGGRAGGGGDDHSVGDGFGEKTFVDEDVNDSEMRIGAAVDEDFVQGVDVWYRGVWRRRIRVWRQAQGNAFASRGEDADFEAVAQQYPGAALGSEGFTADSTPICFRIWDRSCILFKWFRYYRPILQDCITLARGAGHVHLPECSLVVRKLPLTQEAESSHCEREDWRNGVSGREEGRGMKDGAIPTKRGDEVGFGVDG